jgi:chromosome partitioning protein
MEREEAYSGSVQADEKTPAPRVQQNPAPTAGARRSVGLVREEEQVLNRSIPLRVVLTRTSPQIPTRNEKMIIAELRSAGIPMMRTHLNQRAAFSSLFTYKLTLDELDPAAVNGLDAAVTNAAAFAAEVVEVIRSLTGKAAA